MDARGTSAEYPNRGMTQAFISGRIMTLVGRCDMREPSFRISLPGGVADIIVMAWRKLLVRRVSGNKLKQFRHVATRYDKLAATFNAMIKFACVRLWLSGYESGA